MKYLKLFEDFNREGKVDVNEINNIITERKEKVKKSKSFCNIL